MASLRDRIYSLETEYAVNFFHLKRGRGEQRSINPDELARLICKVLVRLYGHEEQSFLITGAKLERDTGHVEWSLPECRSALEVVAYDQAADFLLPQAAKEVEAMLNEDQVKGSLKVFKNNVDSAGKSYGCHENYLTYQKNAFLNESSFLAYLIRCLTPFLVTRQIFTGTGWLVPKQLSPTGRTQFALAQRAFFITKAISKDTRKERAIINLAREKEPLASGNFRRLHLILGDSNLSPWATWLKLGITGILLRMIEDLYFQDVPTLADSVNGLRTVALDPTCRSTLALRNGKKAAAIDIQWEYFRLAREYLSQSGSSAEEERLMEAWMQALKDIEVDPLKLADRADWAMKYRLLTTLLQQDGCSWEQLENQFTTMRASDMLYHDLSGDGYFTRMRHLSPALTERWITAQEIQLAASQPPEFTRAYIRGRAVRLAREENARLKMQNWDNLEVNGQTVAMLDPLAFDEPGWLNSRPFEEERWRRTLLRPELDVRVRAASYLAWPCASEATDLLLEVLRRTEEHLLVRKAAVESLGLRADQRARGIVLDTFLHDPCIDVRWAAEEALNRIEDGVPASPPKPPEGDSDEGALLVQIVS